MGWGVGGGGSGGRRSFRFRRGSVKGKAIAAVDSAAIDVTNFILKMAFATADGERWV